MLDRMGQRGPLGFDFEEDSTRMYFVKLGDTMLSYTDDFHICVYL